LNSPGGSTDGKVAIYNYRLVVFVALQLFREVKIMKMLDHPNIGTVDYCLFIFIFILVVPIKVCFS